MGRKHVREHGMPGQLVRQMRDIGLPCPYFREEIQRLLQGGVRVVVFDLDAAERDVFHAFQFLQLRLAVQLLDIGQVSDIAWMGMISTEASGADCGGRWW